MNPILNSIICLIILSVLGSVSLFLCFLNEIKDINARGNKEEK